MFRLVHFNLLFIKTKFSNTQTKIHFCGFYAISVKIEKPLKHLIRYIYIKCVIYEAKYAQWRMVFIQIAYTHIAKCKMYVQNNWGNHRSENFNEDIDMFAINRIKENHVN